MKLFEKALPYLEKFGFFAGGIVASVLLDELWKGKITRENDFVLYVLLGLLLLLIILVGVLSLYFKELKITRETLNKQISDIANQFGLSVEFVSDEDGYGAEGITYDRTRQLIENAKKSLVFLDFWVQTGNYIAENDKSYSARDAYYITILNKLKEFEHHDGENPFMRRIIQFPSNNSSLSEDAQISLKEDKLFNIYLKECKDKQSRFHKTCVIKIVRPLIRSHFLIIDSRYVVWPVLASNREDTGLRRHGAIIFTDSSGSFVSRLMDIYNRIDAQAIPLDSNILAPSQNSKISSAPAEQTLPS
jgi:hypothetical protein